MSRLFFLLAVIIVIYLVIRSFRNNTSGSEPQSGEVSQTEDMVRCVHCGVHLPRSESILSQGQSFCSTAHRDAFRK